METAPLATDRETQLRLQARRKAALRRVGMTQADLAARIGVSRQSVGLVLADHHRSRRVEQAIADACGVAAAELFPADRPVGAAEPVKETKRAMRAANVHLDRRERVGSVDLESRVRLEIGRFAQEALLAVADGDLERDDPAVRAVVAAVRELHK